MSSNIWKKILKAELNFTAGLMSITPWDLIKPKSTVKRNSLSAKSPLLNTVVVGISALVSVCLIRQVRALLIKTAPIYATRTSRICCCLLILLLLNRTPQVGNCVAAWMRAPFL